MKMPQVAAPSGDDLPERVDVPQMLKKLSQCAELLCQPLWAEGTGKGQRSVFCFFEGKVVKLLVKVENPPLKLLVSGNGWDEAWAALEVVLRSDQVPWQLDTGPKPKGAGKRK